MKTMNERIRQRLRKDRPMATISMRMPQDVIDDLKEIAPSLGFSGYQPLIRSYIGSGLRRDLERLQDSPLQLLTESLRKQGLSEEAIADVILESRLQPA